MSSSKASLQSEPPPTDEAALMRAWRKLLHERFKVHLSGERFTTTSLRALRTRAWSELYGGSDNERLEWLGDAVCAFYGSLFIFETAADEQQVPVLEYYLQRLTTGRFQQEIAADLQLEELALIPSNYIPVVRADRLETREVLLGNVFEALVAAVFLQSHEAAKKMLYRLFRRELHTLPRERRTFSRPYDAAFFPRNPTEWLGYYSLRLMATQRLQESHLTLYEAHVARMHCLRAERVTILAEVLGIRQPADRDPRAARRLLRVVGTKQALGTSLVVENALGVSTDEFDRFCRGATPTASPPEPIEPPPIRPLAALKLTLDGYAEGLLPQAYDHGDGRTRIELTFNGVVLGVGIHADIKEALQLAAHDALLNDSKLAHARAGKF